MPTVTPWGRAEESVQIRRGIMSYQAKGHDIVRLSPLTLEQMPDYMRHGDGMRNDGWFEGEVNTALPVLMFERDFKIYHDIIDGPPAGDRFLSRAHEIVSDVYPEIYDRWKAEHGAQSLHLNDIELPPSLASSKCIRPRS